MIDTQLSGSISLQPVRGRRKWAKPAILTMLVLIIALLPLLINSPYLLHIIIITFIYTAASVSLRAIIISGQFPTAHGAFMGIGAYAAGMASRWLGWSPWLTIPMGGIVAMVIGMLFSYPFCRLRSLYYAMGSLFFGIAVISVIQSSGTVTGGYSGLAGIAPLFSGTSKIPYYYFFLGLALITVIALYRFEFSRIGLTLKAIAQSHLVASSVGISESRYRILAVGVGCFFVGLVGAGFTHYKVLVTPTSFDLLATLWIIMYVLIGGIDSFAGPIIGTPILFLIPEYFRGLKEYSPLLTAGIMVIIVYFMPGGIVGLIKHIISWYGARKTEKVKGALHAS